MRLHVCLAGIIAFVFAVSSPVKSEIVFDNIPARLVAVLEPPNGVILILAAAALSSNKAFAL